MAKDKHSGSCLCGAVAFEVAGKLREALFCHCRMCQKTHGAPVAYAAADDADLKLTEDRGLKWYASSDFARRGFCTECGGSLFWQRNGAGYTAIACGMLDKPTGVTAQGHIFLCDQGDYYVLTDELPKFDEGTNGQLPSRPSAV